MTDYKLTACAIDDYIYDSVDRAITWIPESGSFVNLWTCIAASSDGKKLIATSYFDVNDAYAYGEVYRSVDSGATWTKIIIDMEPHVWFSVASSSDGNILYAGDLSFYSPSSGLYRSLDGGVTWEKTYSGNYLWTAIACSVDGKIVTASGIEGLVVSTDTGETWTPIIVEGKPQWYWADCSTDGRFIVATDYSENGYIWTIRITQDSGIQVKKQLNSGPIGWHSVACSGNGSTIVASNSSADLYISYNYGEDWIKKWSEPTFSDSWYPVACSKDGMCLAGGILYGPMITSFDGGITWTRGTIKQWTRIIIATESEVCVLGKTKILMGDGSLKPIKDIVRGEGVVTDKATGATKQVARVLVSVSKGTAICLPKCTLGNTEDVICTEAHPVWALDGSYRMKSKDVNGAIQIENWDTFYSIQYEEEGTYYAEGIRMDSVSPYYYKKRLPRKLYFNRAKHDKRVIVKDENDPRRGKPKMI